MQNKSRAFTLIELLVVVLIIGILAAVAVPQYQKAIIKSRVSTILPVLKAIKNAEEVYYMTNGDYSIDTTELGIQLPANCTAVTGGDGGLYKCGDSFLLDLDNGLDGKTIANYCPNANSSPAACGNVREFQLRFYYVHNAIVASADKLICLPINDGGKKKCKLFGTPYVGGQCGSSSGCSQF